MYERHADVMPRFGMKTLLSIFSKVHESHTDFMAVFKNCRKSIRQLFFIVTSGPEDFLKLSHPDVGIIFYW